MHWVGLLEIVDTDPVFRLRRAWCGEPLSLQCGEKLIKILEISDMEERGRMRDY
jgi:hypothetical protein